MQQALESLRSLLPPTNEEETSPPSRNENAYDENLDGTDSETEADKSNPVSAGDFEAAAASFARDGSAEAVFNRGNALILLGEYQAAIQAFRRALQLRPDWRPAQTNLAIAEARLQALAPPEDDAGGTGGKLAADEIVFDLDGRTDNAKGEHEIQGSGPASDEELRALWLRRVQTRPADFLRVRFAQQLRKRQPQENKE